jgi:hypothetical protein
LGELTYQTLESPPSRRVVGKTEYLPGKANFRFVLIFYAGGSASIIFLAFLSLIWDF